MFLSANYGHFDTKIIRFLLLNKLVFECIMMTEQNTLNTMVRGKPITEFVTNIGNDH